MLGHMHRSRTFVKWNHRKVYRSDRPGHLWLQMRFSFHQEKQKGSVQQNCSRLSVCGSNHHECRPFANDLFQKNKCLVRKQCAYYRASMKKTSPGEILEVQSFAAYPMDTDRSSSADLLLC